MQGDASRQLRSSRVRRVFTVEFGCCRSADLGGRIEDDVVAVGTTSVSPSRAKSMAASSWPGTATAETCSLKIFSQPIALPVAKAAGFDLIWFGVMTVVAVEIGLLTPPFGLSVYTIKSSIDDRTLKVGDIFRGAFPFVLAMIACLAVLTAFPGIASWLARL